MAGQGNKNRKRTVRESAPALLQRVDIISNENKSTSVSVLQGTVRVLYWESILADTVSASIVFTDAGNTMTRTKKGQGHGKRRKKVSAVECLPIIGQEKVALKFTDNNDNTLDFDTSLSINTIKALPTSSQTTSKSYEIVLVSNEFFDNSKVWVNKDQIVAMAPAVKELADKDTSQFISNIPPSSFTSLVIVTLLGKVL